MVCLTVVTALACILLPSPDWTFATHQLCPTAPCMPLSVAITKAKKLGIEHLSLAATPACPYPSSRFFRWATRRAVRKAGGAGLRQFKSTFAPS